MPSQFLLNYHIRRIVDEHEMMAFELESILLQQQRMARLVPAYKKALVESIRNHRELSRTYKPYEGVIDGGRNRNSS